MKSVQNRHFWTEVGRVIAGDVTEKTAEHLNLSSEMLIILEEGEFVRGEPELVLRIKMTPRERRHIYSHTWEILRDFKFSRALRIYPWDDIELYFPFFKDKVAVIPQSFSSRIPHIERAYSVVGKSSAARAAGWTLWVVMGNWDEEAVDILRRGGVRCCSLDGLKQVLSGESS